MPDFTPLQDAIDAVLRGTPDAFLAVVRAQGPPLRAFLASQIFHLDDVDDLAQEIFIAAYRSLHTFRRGEDFGAWLRGIARHKLARYFEQTSRRSTAMKSFHEDAIHLLNDELEAAAARTRAEHLQAMLRCIGKLGERLRHVVRSLLDGGKAAALAKELNTTPGAIYQLQYRALQTLRECTTKELTHGS